MQVRIVWKGGDTTAAALPVTVGALTRLAGVEEMEKEILKLAKQGHSDEEIADRLDATRLPFPSTPQRAAEHGQDHPATAPVVHQAVPIAPAAHPRSAGPCRRWPRALAITPHWIYDRIHNGTIQVSLHPELQLYLLPDRPQTLTLFKQLRAGRVQKLRF